MVDGAQQNGDFIGSVVGEDKLKIDRQFPLLTSGRAAPAGHI